MKMKRLFAIVAVVTFLLMGTVSPKPAHAFSTSDILILTGAAIVGWVAFVVIGAQIAYRKSVGFSEDPGELPANGKHAPERVRFGVDCHPTSAEPSPVVCW